MSLLAWHLRFDHEKDKNNKFKVFLAYLGFLV